MSKGLSSYPPERRPYIALRRIKNPTFGNGYLAAKDYMQKVSLKNKINKKANNSTSKESTSAGTKAN